jgi:glycine C-acetyltransferase
MTTSSYPPSLNGSMLDYGHGEGANLLERLDAGYEWSQARLADGFDSFQKYIEGPVGTRIKAHLRDGTEVSGINFASQDYLSLASAPAVREAARDAVSRHGVHSAGSAALMGLSVLTNQLERELAEYTGYADCTLFPIAWGAGYGAITALVGPQDHVVLDALSHACLQEGARAATKNVHRFPHLSHAAVERKLARLRSREPDAGILVATETVFSMDSDSPDLRALQAICRKYEATLLVDVAHDLGALGERGLGVMEEQDMVGKLDLLMGSFSKTFATPGGFVCSQRASVKWGLRYRCGPSTFTNAMTPIQASVARASLEIVRSSEGRERRRRLLENVLHLRARLQALGFEVLGRPTPIIPVVVGDTAMGRVLTKYALSLGSVVNLAEYPAVSAKSSRLRVQMMAEHTREQLDAFAEILAEARALASAECRRLSEPPPALSLEAPRLPPAPAVPELSSSHAAR